MAELAKELLKGVESLELHPPHPTIFVISTIAYEPEHEDGDVSSDDTDDGTFESSYFNFDDKREETYPFTTKNPITRTKRTKNAYAQLNIDEFERTPGSVVNDFLRRISYTAFESCDNGKYDTLAVCIMLNRMKSISQRRNDSLRKEQDSAVNSRIRYEKFSFMWECEWFDRKGDGADYDTVRKFYKQLKRRDNEKAKAFINVRPPFNILREEVKNSELTKILINELRECHSDSNLYLSIIDDDTIDFNGIYSAYLRIVSEIQKERGTVPTVMSTGYVFPPSEEFGNVFKIGSELDREIRVMTADRIPLGVYYPEPNMCILIPKDICYLPESFLSKTRGKPGCESACLLRQVRLREKSNFVFSGDKPIVTSIPPRAKLNKSWNTPITFSPLFRKGASPTEADFSKLKQIAQSHFHEFVWLKSLFINHAIEYTKYDDFSKYVQGNEKLELCRKWYDLAMKGKEGSDSRKDAICKLKELIPNHEAVDAMVVKRVDQLCIKLIMPCVNHTDDVTYNKNLRQLKLHIAPRIVDKIIEAGKAMQKRVSECKIDYIGSADIILQQEKLIEFLDEYELNLSHDEREELLRQPNVVDELEELSHDSDSFSKFIELRGEGLYPVMTLLEAYQDDPLHLDFMLDDPTNVVYENSDDPEIVRFGFENYGDEVDIPEIMEQLNFGRGPDRLDSAAAMDFNMVLCSISNKSEFESGEDYDLEGDVENTEQVQESENDVKNSELVRENEDDVENSEHVQKNKDVKTNGLERMNQAIS